MPTGNPDTALWAITPNGLEHALKTKAGLNRATLFLSRRLASQDFDGEVFDRLQSKVTAKFNDFQRHLFFMSTGIVVRLIAPLIRHKTRDPAVVVVDDAGHFAISLVAGHIGGANAFAHEVAQILHATPVVTTATDANGKPAIDVIALEHGLIIENAEAIKAVNMALLTDVMVATHDPYGILGNALPHTRPMALTELAQYPGPAVYVDDRCQALGPKTLILRPLNLTAGIGCNRGTPKAEILGLLREVMGQNGLSELSLKTLASIDLKSDEQGLLAGAECLQLPIVFFNKTQLNRVEQIPNPSAVVNKHIGARSVCEAAAILSAQGGDLIVTKQKSNNVTVALGRLACS